MSFSYSGDPASSELDQVRFLLKDTDPADYLLEDEELNWLITEETDPYSAAAAACNVLATKYARKADMAVGDLRIMSSQRSKAYKLQAKELRQLALRNSGAPKPYAGGTSVADKKLDEDNTDVPERFRIGIHDFPDASADWEDED